MSNKEIENKVDELKEELKNEKTETVVNEDSKVRKIVTWCLKGVALVATGLVGFFVGQHIGGDKDDDETHDEEKTEE